MINGSAGVTGKRPQFVDLHQPIAYLPHIDQPTILALGMTRERDVWIEPCEDLPAWQAYKRALRLAEQGRVYGIIPGAQDACSELARCVGALPWVPASAKLGTESSVETLWAASLWVADDLVVMMPSAQGYVLAAASLCSPSHWRLEDKLGLPMRRVHDPIPRIHDTLSAPIDRFFDRLRGDKPVQRFNWSLQTATDYYAPIPEHESVTEDTPLFYRVERQTLRRLPQTGAIAFTIRVYLHPLERLAQYPGALPRLLAAIAETPEDIADYKGFPRLAPALAKFA